MTISEPLPADLENRILRAASLTRLGAREADAAWRSVGADLIGRSIYMDALLPLIDVIDGRADRLEDDDLVSLAAALGVTVPDREAATWPVLAEHMQGIVESSEPWRATDRLITNFYGTGLVHRPDGAAAYAHFGLAPFASIYFQETDVARMATGARETILAEMAAELKTEARRWLQQNAGRVVVGPRPASPPEVSNPINSELNP